MVAVGRRTSRCALASRSATQPRRPFRAGCWRRSAAAMWLPSGRPTPSGLPHPPPTSRSFFFLCLTYRDAAVVLAARGEGAGDAASVCGGGVGCLRPGGTRQVADQRRARRLTLGGCSTLVVVGGWWRRRGCPRAGRRPRRGGGNPPTPRRCRRLLPPVAGRCAAALGRVAHARAPARAFSWAHWESVVSRFCCAAVGGGCVVALGRGASASIVTGWCVRCGVCKER